MMHVVIGADESRPVVEVVAARFRARGHNVSVLGAAPWGPIATRVAEAVARGEADQGVVLCWTGTGVSIAANKVTGVRAALAVDAATARGARRWNDANVLALSLRLLSDSVAIEIVDAWLDSSYEGSEAESLAVIAASESRKPA